MSNAHRLQQSKCHPEKKWQTNRESFSTGRQHSLAVGKGTKGTHNPNPKSLMELSSRTVRKILKRLGISCSKCGWNEATCDLHHIQGRKIDNANSHQNLTYICPNCHRKVHEGKLQTSELVTLEQHIGDSWKEHYFG